MQRTIPNSQELSEEEMLDGMQLQHPDGLPRVRDMKVEDCCYPDAPRPCPMVSCRFNNYLNVNDRGAIVLTWPDKQPEDVDPDKSCALDVANRGQDFDEPLTLEELAPFFGASRQTALNVLDEARSNAKKHAFRIGVINGRRTSKKPTNDGSGNGSD